MRYIGLDDIRPLGDPGARAALLAGRLEDTVYRPESIFTMDTNGWPGDWEGRAILAQTMISRLTGSESAHLRENVLALPSQFNDKGYLKGILPEGEFDEQQFSGHGWLIRGLCEYWDYTGDACALGWAKRIAENLFLPAQGHFADYPILPEERVCAGGAAGNIAGNVRGWHISTDTGCAFIPIDGLSRLYEITGDGRLRRLLAEMISRFFEVDLPGIRAQTHATLSACRGILRMYQLTHESEYLSRVIDIFSLYRKWGMTANYANFNWFRRPEWTEPCAIVDSLIVAMELFRHTGQIEYADLARNILRNGLARSQRPNGGFGCDSCADESGIGSGDFLSVRIYEASWCCTMRGAEGLAMAARFGYLIGGDTVTMLLPQSSIADMEIGGGHVRIWQRADQSREGHVEIRVLQNTSRRPVKLRILLPEWVNAENRFRERFLPAEGESVHLNIPVPLRRVGRKLFWGSEMLGSSGSPRQIDLSSLRRKGRGFTDGENDFLPIANGYLQDKEALEREKTRILF